MSKAKVGEVPQSPVKVYWVRRDGTGKILPARVLAHMMPENEQVAWVWHPTYAEAREYAQRTTDEACRVADRNRAAAGALPEHEPEAAQGKEVG